jgi:hypothetical protein
MLAGCSSSGETPTSPTPSGPPVVSNSLPSPSAVLGISILGDQWITTDSAPVQMIARLETSRTPFDWVDGSEGVSWRVEPAGIATIDSRGRVTPIGIGQARAIATYGAHTGENPFRVLPNFAGTWSGEFIVANCEGGNDPRTCGRLMFNQGAGVPVQYTRYPFTVTLTQFRDSITGTLHEALLTPGSDTPVAGFVRLSGHLVLEGSMPQTGLQPLRILNWSSTVNAASTQMSGAYTRILPQRSPFGTDYTVRTEHEFSGVSKTR